MTRAASCAESSLTISARSDGCSRERRCLRHGELTFSGLTSLIGRDVVPSDQRARDAVEQFRRDPIRAEPAQQARDADVGGDDAQRIARARDLDVVDANDLAAVDVDDLLVEQVVDQVEGVVLGRREFVRRDAEDDRSLIVDVAHGRDRCEARAVAGLDDERVDARKRVARSTDQEVADLADGPAAGHRRRRPPCVRRSRRRTRRESSCAAPPFTQHYGRSFGRPAVITRLV